MSACRSCSAPIEWALTDAGRRMPLDLGTHADGNLARVGRTSDGTPIVAVLPLAVLVAVRESGGTVELRRTHFVTCPDAGDWRRS